MESPPKHRWQFSIRGMLLMTSAVAVVLCFAVKLPLAFQIVLIVVAISCIVAAILWTANFATSDRRPWLAMISWSVFGLFFLLLAFAGGFAAIRQMLFAGGVDVVASPFAVVMGACGIVCVYRAVRAFLLASGLRSADSTNDSNQ